MGSRCCRGRTWEPHESSRPPGCKLRPSSTPRHGPDPCIERPEPRSRRPGRVVGCGSWLLAWALRHRLSSQFSKLHRNRVDPGNLWNIWKGASHRPRSIETRSALHFTSDRVARPGVGPEANREDEGRVIVRAGCPPPLESKTRKHGLQVDIEQSRVNSKAQEMVDPVFGNLEGVALISARFGWWRGNDDPQGPVAEEMVGGYPNEWPAQVGRSKDFLVGRVSVGEAARDGLSVSAGDAGQAEENSGTSDAMTEPPVLGDGPVHCQRPPSLAGRVRPRASTVERATRQSRSLERRVGFTSLLLSRGASNGNSVPSWASCSEPTASMWSLVAAAERLGSHWLRGLEPGAASKAPRPSPG